jgi:hypothetical protein
VFLGKNAAAIVTFLAIMPALLMALTEELRNKRWPKESGVAVSKGE